MRTNLKIIIILLLLLLVQINSYGQEVKGKKASYFSKSSSMKIVKPLDSKAKLIPAKSLKGEVKDGRSSRYKVIIGKGSTGDDILVKKTHRLAKKIPGKTPEQVYDAVNNIQGAPSDPALAVGPNHVFVVYNTGFIIYDKAGKDLTGKTSVNNIFDPGGCCDLTVSYDSNADRWVISYLFIGGQAQVAVSQGRNPVTSSWAVYTFDNIDDYQKLSIWSDGYYLTANIGGNPAVRNAVFALDRKAMLAGEPSAKIIGFPLAGAASGGFFSPQVFNVSDKNMPAPGNAPVVYLQDDAFGGISKDHLKIWTVNPDFDNPANSTISSPTILDTTPFISTFDGGSFENLQQPNGGSSIDAIQGTIMNQAQFRKFDTHNSAIFNFVVDTDGSANKLAGIRWYELRQSGDGQPWSIYQEGTYTSNDGKHAWLGSMIMDDLGNIALGYTGMGGTTDTFVSSYYTGRFPNDPLGTMTISETLISAGTRNIRGIRYGDYNKIDVDPNSDRKFWFINESTNNNGVRDVVGVFQIAPNRSADAGVVDIDLPQIGSFTANQDIKINIFNFGEDPISNFEVSYQIDAGAVVTEMFTGTIASNTVGEYTFTQKADLSIQGKKYEVSSTSGLTGDEFKNNDKQTISITHLFNSDVGISAINTPKTGEGLGNVPVVVTLNNFGGKTKSNFDLSYSIDGGTAVVETFTGSIDPVSKTDYIFNALANISEIKEYSISSTTLLASDAKNSNDGVQKSFANVACISKTDNTPQDLPSKGTKTIESKVTIDENFVVRDVNVNLNIEHTYTADLDIKLKAPDGTEVVLASGAGQSGNNFTNTTFDDEASNMITTSNAPFTGSFIPKQKLMAFAGLSSQGEWTLSVTDGFDEDGGRFVDWTLDVCSIDRSVLSVGENFAVNSTLNVFDKGNDQYQISLVTNETNDVLTMDVFNMSGQRLTNYKLENNNGKYLYDLDMSYASAGIYIVRLSNSENATKTKRIIVR